MTLDYPATAGDTLGTDLYIVLRNNSGQTQVNWDKVELTLNPDPDPDPDSYSCSSFYEPFAAPMTVKKKVKRALPLKFNLYDDAGNLITDADLVNPPVVQVFYDPSYGSDIDGYEGDLLPNGLSDDGNRSDGPCLSGQWYLGKSLNAPGDSKSTGTRRFPLWVESGHRDAKPTSSAICPKAAMASHPHRGACP